MSIPAARETRKLIKKKKKKRQKEKEAKKPKRKYQFQNEVPQFLGYCNYLVTEEIKRGNPFYKKINVLNNVKSSHNFKSLCNVRVQNPDHL